MKGVSADVTVTSRHLPVLVGAMIYSRDACSNEPVEIRSIRVDVVRRLLKKSSRDVRTELAQADYSRRNA